MTAPLCLLTRPAAQSRAFAARLPGVEVLIAPVLRIEPLPFDRAKVEAAQGFVFTSANAVPFAGPGAGRSALCVGPQTALAARQAGFSVEIGPGDAKGLLPLLSGRKDWLHLHGRHRALVLPIDGVEAYDQVEQALSDDAEAAILGTRPLVLPLFSPRSALILSGALRDAVAPVATVAISERTDASYTGPAATRRVADQPDAEGMISAIRSLISAASVVERTEIPWVEAERGRR
ncbi:uroporphyrinogen-III synthase [Paracoccus aurantiacus]|uniref:Uroporphyrinogen-III synthase n=1 Tax=Paracoccus aurantiacus TaxID=2599412 RepID=A0A5C6S878_9RHOB|nr:uroporphyrinogen-III synthase [Paracoccus aurantiacus]TXB69844.1 uroporphyrinogen-III synthase [Paracoccus aurantiacus]